MKQQYIASVSCGKYSLCMLLLLIEQKYPLDQVIFYNTGMEFQAIYNVRDKVLPLLKKHNIKYTEIKPKNTFEFDMFERKINKKDGTTSKGYSWCGGLARWGTRQKLNELEKVAKQTKGSIEYVAIAYNEQQRAKESESKRYPLIEWQITETEALQYCYDKGYNWDENGVDLYEVLDRVSCWCCRNKNLKELKNYYLYLPEYWKRLKEMQNKTDRPFYQNKRTIQDLEKRFKKEIKETKKQKIIKQLTIYDMEELKEEE